MDRKPSSGHTDRRRNPSAPYRPTGSAVKNNASAGGYTRRPAGTNDRYGKSNTQANRQGASNGRRGADRKKSPYGFVPVVLLLCVVALLVYICYCWIVSTANKSTFCDNIYVNGFELTDYDLEGGQAALEAQIDERLNTVYTLSCQGKTWNFSPADFDAHIDLSDYLNRAWNIGHIGNMFQKSRDIAQIKDFPVEFTAPLQYNTELIDQMIEQMYADVYFAPKDAEIAISTDRPYILSDSYDGYELDRESAKSQIIALLENGSGSTELPINVLEPAISSDAAEGGMEIIVEVSTDVSFRDSNSRFNVKKALGYFNGICVYPGDTIDFNELVGPRSEERGWRSGAEFVDGQVSEGFGGGVCQASSTLYNAVLKAGMTILQRSSHSMRVSYVEPSFDATVADNGTENFVFQNNTDHAIYIYTNVDRENASIRIYGNRPDYRYELYTNIISQDAECTKQRYEDDVDGKHCYYINDVKLKTKGLPAMKSEGWLISYDWESDEEVSRRLLSLDNYASGTDVYYRGVHAPTVTDPSFVQGGSF